MRRPITAGLLLMLLLAHGCASSRGGRSSAVRTQLGNATANDLFTNAGRVFAQYRYTVEHSETTPQLVLMQSGWVGREPSQDEMLLGVTDAQNRITLSGRWRIETQQGALYSVDMVLESRVVMLNVEGWTEAPDTRSWREYSAAVVRDLRQALDVGTRRF